MKIVAYKGVTGETRIIESKDKPSGVERRSRCDTLSQKIADYWRTYPDAQPKEIAKALGLKDGNYVSQVLYRLRKLARANMSSSDVRVQGQAELPSSSVQPESVASSAIDVPAEMSEVDRKRIVADAVSCIHQKVSNSQSPSSGTEKSVMKSPTKVISVAQHYEDALSPHIRAEYERMKNLLGKVMIHLLHNKMIDKDIIRYYIFNTVAIRSESDYQLYVKLTQDENSWLYTLEDTAQTEQYIDYRDGTHG